MNHSPATIAMNLLIDSGYFTDPDNGGLWPGYIGHLPDSGSVEDNAGVIYDTKGEVQGVVIDSGALAQGFGFQVMVRSLVYSTGWKKIKAIQGYLSGINRESVTVDEDSYVVESFSLQGSPLSLGLEKGSKRRQMFTINGLIHLKGE